MEILHVTGITKFAKCPYHYKYEEFGALDPKIVYPGDILNISVTSQWWEDAFIDQYVKLMNGDFKFLQIMKDVLKESRAYIEQIRRLNKKVYQEAKMYYKHSDDLWIVWTPDLFYYDDLDDRWNIRDFKFGKHSWYSNEEIKATDAQIYIYSLMVCNYFNIDKVSFGFKVRDKWNWSLRDFGWTITKEEAQKWTDDVLNRYQECVVLWHRPSTPSRSCWFNKMEWCPSPANTVDSVEMDKIGF